MPWRMLASTTLFDSVGCGSIPYRASVLEIRVGFRNQNVNLGERGFEFPLTPLLKINFSLSTILPNFTDIYNHMKQTLSYNLLSLLSYCFSAKGEGVYYNVEEEN